MILYLEDKVRKLWEGSSAIPETSTPAIIVRADPEEQLTEESSALHLTSVTY